MPSGDMRFFEAILPVQPHELSFVAKGPFSVVTEDSHTVTIHRPDKSVKTISRQRVAKKLQPDEQDASKNPSVLNGYSCIFDLPACHRSLVVILQVCGFMKRGTSSNLAKVMDSMTFLYNVEYHSAIACEMFSNYLEFVISRIIDRPDSFVNRFEVLLTSVWV